MLGLVFTLSFIILFMGVPGNFFSLPGDADLVVGEKLSYRVVSDREYQFVDTVNTRRRMLARTQLARPVYKIREDITTEILASFDYVAQTLRTAKENGLNPSEVFLQLEDIYTGRFRPSDILNFLSMPSLDTFLDREREILVDVMELGVLEANSTQIPTQGIEMRSSLNSGEVRIPISRNSVLVFNKHKLLFNQMREARSLPSVEPGLADVLLQPNTFFDKDATEEMLGSIERNTPPVMTTIRKGQVLLEDGEIITTESRNRILELSGSLRGKLFSKGLSIVIVLVLVFVLWFTFFPKINSSVLKDYSFQAITAVIWIFFLTYSVTSAAFWPSWVGILFSPLGLVVLFVTFLSQPLTGAVFSLLISLPVLFFVSPLSFTALGISQALTAFFITKVKGRIDLFKAGLLLGVLNFLLSLSGQFWSPDWNSDWLIQSVLFGLNGLLTGILALGLLPPLELVLNLPTRFRLQELSDLNAPILKKMLSLAPGTYAHSVNVSHLSENAARAIGADALLSRVGAIYHDIGKIEQAEYFVENQHGFNKHDELKPNMSVAILKAHVRNGIEKGKELSLPQKIMDIILQHHGNGLIEFFYSKACEAEKKELSKDEFRYPGPNPQFKESAVVMFADTVEAACRTLKNPNRSTLERYISDLIQKKVNEELLNDSGLSLGEIQKIKDSLIQTMAGQFHSRIEYPDGGNGR